MVGVAYSAWGVVVVGAWLVGGLYQGRGLKVVGGAWSERDGQVCAYPGVVVGGACCIFGGAWRWEGRGPGTVGVA